MNQNLDIFNDCENEKGKTMAAIERQTAHLTPIATLVSGTFVKAEAQFQPSYIQTPSGRKINRVHLIAVVVSLPDIVGQGATPEATLDDGTGKIIARSFENPSFFTGIQLGDILRIIGKVRVYHEQVYLLPELIKKISNKQWVHLHKLQIQALEKQYQEIGFEEIPLAAEEEAPQPSPLEDFLTLIKSLDEGNGVLMELLLQKAGTENEKLLHYLLESGEIFEIAPGRVKVLD